ncbi:Hypothetical predicted protein [Pelobates cultripes]|nr:Hypothetical predicted protein [Pelobates cultripes]
MAAARKPCARLASMIEPIAERITELEQGKSGDKNIYHSRGKSGAERVTNPLTATDDPWGSCALTPHDASTSHPSQATTSLLALHSATDQAWKEKPNCHPDEYPRHL